MFDPLEPDDAAAVQRTRLASTVLWAAAAYNIVWGLVVIAFPMAAFNIFGMEPPQYPEIWQCVGMIVGVYGIGYGIAARDPYRHWPIVLVGLLGKVFGPVGFLFSAVNGNLPWMMGWTIVFNDLIWWIPFAFILYQAMKANSNTSVGRPHDLEDTSVIFASQLGKSLAELSQDRPLMLVFLRHFGCTFCKEALADLSAARAEVERLGFNIALVHMSDVNEAQQTMRRYQLSDLHHYSDGSCEMYRSFGLERGTAGQLFGLSVVLRAIAATLRGHIVGPLAGDGFRMPGVFFLYRGEIHGSFRHRTAADRPDYASLAQQCQRALRNEISAV